MTLLLSHSEVSFAIEAIERAALVQIKENLDARLAEQETYWTNQDQAFADAMGLSLSDISTTLEPVDITNYYTGHVPSLIKAPVTQYPNVAALVTESTPGSGSIDQGDSYVDNLFIEFMVKSSKDEPECNRRVRRMAEAINNCITGDETLGGIITAGFESSPTLIIGDCFVRDEKTSYGAKWFWQGARLEYSIRKDSISTSNASSNVTPLFKSRYPGLDIDQE